MSIKQVHRYVSLAFLALWIVQGVTGTLSVFRWELDDATVAGARAPVDWPAIGRTIDRLSSQADMKVSSVWTSGTSDNRFDIHYTAGDDDRTMRVDGGGRSLRDRSGERRLGDGAQWDSISSIHTSLFAGNLGEWIIGISGLLLLSNIALGLRLAWPRLGSWRKAMLARPAGGRQARLYGWHRMVGLWFAPLALWTIGAGVLMSFGDAVESRLAGSRPAPDVPAAASSAKPIGFAPAIEAALRAFPGAEFSGASLPRDGSPWYRVRVHSNGEVPRTWGATVIFVAASDARVLMQQDAATASPGRKIVDALYPLHTGQIGGWIGRVVVLLLGCALIAMILLGFAQWASHRKPRA